MQIVGVVCHHRLNRRNTQKLEFDLNCEQMSEKKRGREKGEIKSASKVRSTEESQRKGANRQMRTLRSLSNRLSNKLPLSVCFLTF